MNVFKFFFLWIRSLVWFFQIQKLSVYKMTLCLWIETRRGERQVVVMFLPHEGGLLPWLWQEIWTGRFVIRKWDHADPLDGAQLGAFREQELRLRSPEGPDWTDPPLETARLFRARRALRENPVDEICAWDGVEGALFIDVELADGREESWLTMPQLRELQPVIRQLLGRGDVLVVGYFPFNKGEDRHLELLNTWGRVWHKGDPAPPPPNPPPIPTNWLGMLPTWATSPSPPEAPAADNTHLDLSLERVRRVAAPTAANQHQVRTDAEAPFAPGEEGKVLLGMQPVGPGRTGTTSRLVALPLPEPKPPSTAQAGTAIWNPKGRGKPQADEDS